MVADSLLRPALDDFFRIWTVDTVPKLGLRARTETSVLVSGTSGAGARTGAPGLGFLALTPNSLTGSSCLDFLLCWTGGRLSMCRTGDFCE